jgi:hypothetical protein
MAHVAERVNRFNEFAAAADPAEVLEARAQARAYLWSTGDIPGLLDAVDPLQEFAERSGLVDCIGQDHVQQIIAGAFRPYRGGAEHE